MYLTWASQLAGVLIDTLPPVPVGVSLGVSMDAAMAADYEIALSTFCVVRRVTPRMSAASPVYDERARTNTNCNQLGQMMSHARDAAQA